ncbi:hypothetical protein K0B96_04655 [Horticoccus luteus]|uniref:Lipocalin-like protein n=1 Tax=Horticoccus luteus TaxID=2862869 RepID=A0A8F9XKQ1_9BACT|nr:hypothetical protein [Horticoccus luteus]QYM79913.1 hypothetical protein K0B96_04655 [Horticoccus luteus]
MRIRSLLAFAALTFAALGASAAQSGFAGTWKLDVAASSPIKPWDTDTRTITLDGDSLSIARHLTWGKDRGADDLTRAKLDARTVTTTPMTYWLDTWYNNAYIGGDKQQHVTGAWIEPNRVFKLDRQLTLEAQQGDVPVHIYDEYHLSADGHTLKVLEIRSTRDQPLTFVFTRA